jgi:hypothetical protein
MTPEQRGSAENGIWLCTKCARIIDSAEGEAWPVALLEAWKQGAERSAARDSNIPAEDARDLVEMIEAARETVNGFRARWEAGEPHVRRRQDPDRALTSERFWAEAEEDRVYTTQRRAAYDDEVTPQITNALARAELALGPLDPAVLEAKAVAEYAHVNYLGMGEMAQVLQRLASVLELR